MREGARSSRVTRARKLAYEALYRIDRRNAFAQDVISKVIDPSGMSPSDCAFATRLVLGVVSCEGSLDEILNRCMRSPDDAKRDVRIALRISAYEAIYLGKDSHAAVDQGVELVRWIAPKASGLANAVLRKVVREKTEFPFGDPATDVSALAMLEGFPVWLTKMLVGEMGHEGAMAFESACNLPAPIYLFELPASMRENAQGSNRASKVAPPGGTEQVRDVRGIPLHGCLKLNDRRDAASSSVLDAISEGAALVSDASAQAVAALCALAATRDVGACEGVSVPLERIPTRRKGDDASVLELCAGRGTKTIMIQSGICALMGNQASRYVTVDNVKYKCELLSKRAEDYGIHVSEAICAELGEDAPVIPDEAFDLVFIDAPCSGLGTLRRHPEIRWRASMQTIFDDAARDASLLRQASLSVRPCGFLVYATCTITPEENERAIGSFLSSDAGLGFKLVPAFGEDAFKPKLEEGGPDAHFCAVMQRVL